MTEEQKLGAVIEWLQATLKGMSVLNTTAMAKLNPETHVYEVQLKIYALPSQVEWSIDGTIKT